MKQKDEFMLEFPVNSHKTVGWFGLAPIAPTWIPKPQPFSLCKSSPLPLLTFPLSSFLSHPSLKSWLSSN
jgi:hypothetical protein